MQTHPRQHLQFLSAMGVEDEAADAPIGLYRMTGKAKIASAAANIAVDPAFGQMDKTQNAPAPISSVSVHEPRAKFDAQPISGGGFDPIKMAGDAKNLQELYAAIERFDGVAIKKSATRTVIADGNPDAKIMLIGEAPGAEEDRLGKPFVGQAGQLLDKMLGAIGLNRAENAYITNILFWRPPGNRTPSPDEMAACMPFVRRHIQLMQPKILVCLGGVAMKSMFDVKDGIMKLRGSWLDFTPAPGDAPVPALLTYHPAFLLRTPAYKKDSWADLQDLQKTRQRSGDIELTNR